MYVSTVRVYVYVGVLPCVRVHTLKYTAREQLLCASFRFDSGRSICASRHKTHNLAVNYS